MSVTVTEKVSYGSRIGASFKGVIPGIVMFVAAFPLLFWNEGRAVKTARALDEGQGAVIEVGSNATVDSENEGRLVHMSGLADTGDVLEDPEFGVSENCIRLDRSVEIYQWVEHAKTEEKKNLGGSVTKTTTYAYSLEWCRDAVDSRAFKEPGHDNPAAGLEFKSQSWRSENVTFGAFRLNERQIARIGGAREYAFPVSFTSRVARVQLAGGVIYVPEKTTRDNALNNRDVASQTRVGDMRVTYRVVRPHDISIVSKQRGDSFVPFTSKKGDGYQVDLQRDGIADASEMFESARGGNTFMTWILRLAGWLLMFAGIRKVLAPISTLGDVLPFLGSVLSAGFGFVAAVLAFVLTLVTVAVAWIVYRPALGVALLVVAAAGAFLLLKKRGAGPVAAK